MKAFLAISVAMAALVAAAWWHGPLQAQQGAAGSAESKTVSFADATEAPAEASPVGSRRRVFGDRDGRRLGMNFSSVRAALKELKTSGAIDGTEGNGELAAIVADHISSKSENKAAFKAAAIDWDALMAWLERIIALILKFAPLFI